MASENAGGDLKQSINRKKSRSSASKRTQSEKGKFVDKKDWEGKGCGGQWQYLNGQVKKKVKKAAKKRVEQKALSPSRRYRVARSSSAQEMMDPKRKKKKKSGSTNEGVAETWWVGGCGHWAAAI